MRLHTRLMIAIAVLALAVPAVALAAISAPQSGQWTVAGGGGLTVSSSRKSVSGVHISGSDCDLGPLRISGTLPLHLITRAGWIAGHFHADRTVPQNVHGVVGQMVTVHSAKRAYSGRLGFIFDTPSHVIGDLWVTDCVYEFSARP